MNAKIVVGLAFGDEGKGIVTDWLCSQANKPMVIRYSGGQQAGHTVMLDEKKHVHSNFGAGTLRGVPSYFTEHCTVYLNTLENERRVLNDLGIKPKLYIHPLVKLTTPFDVAWGRARNRCTKHGSCGLGVGATMDRHLNSGYKLYAIDLRYPELAITKSMAIYEYYKAKAKNEGMEKEYITELESDSSVAFFLSLIGKYLFDIKEYDVLLKHNLIFEGSQGILLDMDHGIFPHVTYANTTSKNAIELCELLNIDPEVYYVTRCYLTRHGPGWMSNENSPNLINNKEEINTFNEWQTDFRTGELDYNLLNYSLSVDKLYASTGIELDKHLVVTCRDQRPDFTMHYTNFKTEFQSIHESWSPYSKDFKQVK